VQDDDEVAPISVEEEPSGQATQLDTPVVVELYVPAAHLMQAVDAAAPVLAETEPAGQLRQLEAPVLGWYWPMVQLAQENEAAAAAKVPALQGVQVSLASAPDSSE